jgi:MFS family permease
MGLSLLVIGTAFSAGVPVLAVVATWCYMMSFSLGIGPGCWLVASEVFPLVIRAKCMALATVANRVFSSLIASTFLSWAGAMSYSGYFYFVTALSVALWATLYAYLPETSGKSLEAMSEHFASLFGEEVATPPAKAPAVANPMV